MNRMGRATILLIVGAVALQLVTTGGYAFFVQQRMRPLLLAAGIVLGVLGVLEVLGGWWEERVDDTARSRTVGPRVGWLLVLPLAVLVAVAPTGLGAAAADRVEAYTPSNQPESLYEPIGDTAGPTTMKVYEFLDRAIWDPGRSLEERTIRLEGIVVNDPSVPDGFLLTRFMVSCCAADGVPLQVAVRDVPRFFEDDTWVTVDVVWRPPDIPYQEQEAPWTVEADAVAADIDPSPPADPYESPY